MAVALVPPYSVNDIIECKLFSFQGDQLGVNVFHYKVVQAAQPSPQEPELAAALELALHTAVKGVMDAAASFRGVLIRRVKPVASIGSSSKVHQGQGTVVGTPMPPQCSPYLTMYTGAAGRAGRGRIYAPFPSTSFLATDGTLSASGQTAMGALGDTVLAQLVVTGGAGGSMTLSYAIFHRTTGAAEVGVQRRVNFNIGTQVRRSFTRRSNEVPF